MTHTQITDVLDELYSELNELFNVLATKFENETNERQYIEYSTRAIQIAEIQKMIIAKQEEVKERYRQAQLGK